MRDKRLVYHKIHIMQGLKDCLGERTGKGS